MVDEEGRATIEFEFANYILALKQGSEPNSIELCFREKNDTLERMRKETMNLQLSTAFDEALRKIIFEEEQRQYAHELSKRITIPKAEVLKIMEEKENG